MDLLDDLFTDSAVVKVARKFQPKGKARPKKGPSQPAQSIQEQPALTDSSLTKTKDSVGLSKATDDSPEAPAPDVSSIQNERVIPIIPDVSVASSSPLRPCSSQTTHDFPMPSIFEDSGDFQIDVEQLEAGDFSCLDVAETLNEAGSVSGKRASKFKPKPKAQAVAKNMVETLSHLPKDPQLSSDDQPAIDGLTPVRGRDSIPNSLQAGLESNFSMDPATNKSQDVVLEDTDTLTAPDILVQERSKHGEFAGLNSAGNTADEEPLLSGVKVNGEGHDLGTNDRTGGSCKSPTEVLDELASNKEVNDCEDLSKKKRGRRSKNAASGNDKPARKRKKASQEPDQIAVKPPKKFPHATRRKRCVDKSLLEVPEGELDLHKVPMKDLILWGEHIEREAKKQVASAPVATNERIGNLQREGSPYDDDAFGFDQDRDFDDGPSTSGVRTDTGYYNYNTYRKAQPRAKWSKKDTELFYEGIRQFGTDLSMIQQLFPGRSLEQMRSKYRKEQKQNPMMMDDAQTNRATDHSCFELVIKTLEAVREAEEKEYASSEDDSAYPADKQDQPEDNIETDAMPQEMAKSEQDLKDEAAGEEPDKPEVGSPAISHDDDDIWNTYTGL